MLSSHVSQVGWNRAAQHHRTANPALVWLLKAPERAWRLRGGPIRLWEHHVTVAPRTALGIPLACYQT